MLHFYQILELKEKNQLLNKNIHSSKNKRKWLIPQPNINYIGYMNVLEFLNVLFTYVLETEFLEIGYSTALWIRKSDFW